MARGTRLAAAAGASELGSPLQLTPTPTSPKRLCRVQSLLPEGRRSPGLVFPPPAPSSAPPSHFSRLDTGTVLAMRGPADGWAFPAGSDGDYLELTLEALDAERSAEDR